ncbi:MAG: hypothetical protein NXI00_11130 [Cytophagales bacterium]|nr:hypothetical protein [Cytophagales bacterium]
MQDVKTPIKASTNLPASARRSHWQARLRDICEKNGGQTQVAREFYKAMGLKDAILMRNKMANILNNRSAVETASEFVVQLENLLKS